MWNEVKWEEGQVFGGNLRRKGGEAWRQGARVDRASWPVRQDRQRTMDGRHFTMKTLSGVSTGWAKRTGFLKKWVGPEPHKEMPSHVTESRGKEAAFPNGVWERGKQRNADRGNAFFLRPSPGGRRLPAVGRHSAATRLRPRAGVDLPAESAHRYSTREA
jgi:hypothetical protein